MASRVLFVLPLLAATAARALDAEDGVGTWRLASATRKIVDSGEIIDAYGGPRPNGWLTYGRDGRMLVICAFEGWDRPEANDKMSDQDHVKLHQTFFAYAGTYNLGAGKIVHTIDTSWNEVWWGTTQIRQVELKDSELVLTTPPFKFNVDGRNSMTTLVWKNTLNRDQAEWAASIAGCRLSCLGPSNRSCHEPVPRTKSHKAYPLEEPRASNSHQGCGA